MANAKASGDGTRNPTKYDDSSQSIDQEGGLHTANKQQQANTSRTRPGTCCLRGRCDRLRAAHGSMNECNERVCLGRGTCDRGSYLATT